MIRMCHAQAASFTCLGFLWAAAALAQPSASPKALAPRMFRAVRSPEAPAEGRVTFRYFAPGAKRVQLALNDGTPVTMTQDGNGVWSLKTEPLGPGFYPYFFLVDGAPAADPSNVLAKDVAVGGQESLLHVPGPDSLSWEARDIAHGVLHRHEYASEAVAESRQYWVYTPPGFDPAAGKKYPVLYLLHGVMDTPEAWITAGRANVILDNLIERGLARPMIVIFPLGYGFAQVPDRVGDLLLNAMNQRQVMEAFTTTLLEEICPQVEWNYPVRRDRESRAIAGVSMGGAQALYIGLNHPDRFAWIGSFSPATTLYASGLEAFFPHLDKASHPRPRLLWMAIGTRDFLLESNREFNTWLRSKDVPLTFMETPGGHEWTVWHRNLAAFAALLFQSKPVSR